MSLAVFCPLTIRSTGKSDRMYRFHIDNIGVTVTIALCADAADMALRQFFNPGRAEAAPTERPHPILSIDTEWTPVAHESPKDLIPDIVQVSDGQRVVIIQCNQMTRVPTLLMDILNSDEVVLTGVAIAEDLRRIANWAELRTFAFPKVMDLSWMAWQVASSELPRSAHVSGYAPASVALATLSIIFGGIRLDKKLTLVSSWHGSDISEQQVLYASMDVVAACAIYRSLANKRTEGVDNTWFMTVNADDSVNGISPRKWKCIPNLISVVDGLELAVKQKEQATLKAQEERLKMTLPVLRAQKLDLTEDIRRLENRMKGVVRRAIEQEIVV